MNKIAQFFKSLIAFLFGGSKSETPNVPVTPPVVIPEPKPEPQPEPEPIDDPTPLPDITPEIPEIPPVDQPDTDPQPEEPEIPEPESEPEPEIQDPEPEPEEPIKEDPIPSPPVIIPMPPKEDPKPEPLPPAAEKKMLKDLVPFVFAAAVQADQLTKPDYKATFHKYFKRGTPVNDLKMKALQNSKGEFTFKNADKMVNDMIAAGMEVHGHCLVYDAVVNDYFKNFKGTDKEFEVALKKYVQTVVSHFKGRIKSWDAVNEAWDKSGKIEQRVFAKRLGPGYIKKVFIWAHEVYPEVILFLNDYNLQFTGVKTKAVVAFLKECKAEKVPVHGIGNQMHTNIKLDVPQFKKAIKMITDLGFLYHVSELDVKMLTSTPTPEQYEKRSQVYIEVFKAVISSVPKHLMFGITTWGISIADWFENAKAGPGKWVDDPLLFGRGFAENEAYSALVSYFSKK